ncbi:hypothetical protein F383_25917 [Gossypium arboreum]|uniref:Uncharacterized protein n=1 Tax=Gossypium arboreum TaxID=29729 RepID=A0A0B0P642_GOSAR|nr:hypothetical protein F383_25917 [Gossypium arboreum]
MAGLWLRCVICDYVQDHSFTMAWLVINGLKILKLINC